MSTLSVHVRHLKNVPCHPKKMDFFSAYYARLISQYQYSTYISIVYTPWVSNYCQQEQRGNLFRILYNC